MTTSDHVGQPPLTDPTGHAHRTDQANPSGHTDPTLYRTPADAIAAPRKSSPTLSASTAPHSARTR